MAKINGIFATEFRGSVGKVTMRKTKDGNVVSQKITQMTNPNTFPQALQRCAFSNAQKFYALLKRIMDHSFEGHQVGTPCQSAFTQLNSSIIKGAIARAILNPKDADYKDYLVVGRGTSAIPLGWDEASPYISYGSLPALSADFEGSAGNVTRFGVDAMQAITEVDPAKVTGKMIYDALGLSRGDQLTLVMVTANSAALNDKGKTIAEQMYFGRVILPYDEPCLNVVSENVWTFKNILSDNDPGLPIQVHNLPGEGLMKLVLSFDRSGISSLTRYFNAEDVVEGVVAGGIISSRPSTGQRSSSTIRSFLDDNWADNAKLATLGYTGVQIMNVWGYSGDLILNGWKEVSYLEGDPSDINPWG